MSDKLKRALIGAVITVALAAAVSYGLISQQTADTIQSRANQALTEDQQKAQDPGRPQDPAAPSQAPDNSAPRDSAPQEPAQGQTPAPAPRP